MADAYGRGGFYIGAMESHGSGEIRMERRNRMGRCLAQVRWIRMCAEICMGRGNRQESGAPGAYAQRSFAEREIESSMPISSESIRNEEPP